MNQAGTLGTLSILLFGCLSTGYGSEGGPAEITVFKGVHIVHPDQNRIDRDRTVIIEGERILKIGNVDKVDVPQRASIIDGNGSFLLPGLVEMHAHVPRGKQADRYLEDVLFLWVANGVTTIRNMNGETAHLELREQIAAQEILGPRMYTAGPPFMGKRIKTADEANRIAADQIAAGYDLIKVHMGLPRPIYDAVASTAREEQIPFAGHVAESVGLMHALQSGQASIDHLDAYMPALASEEADLSNLDYGLLGAPFTPFVDDTRIAVVAAATADAGVWNAPTLTLAENFVGPYDENDERRDLRYMPPKMVKGWIGIAKGFQKTIDDPEMAEQFLAYRKQLVKALHDAGAGLLLGSDAPQVLNVPGFSTHNELRLMMDAGLTPAEALTTGTVNPAIFLNGRETFGMIAAGLAADLVLVKNNPLDDIDSLREPLGVMVRGRWLAADEIASRLADIARRNAPEADNGDNGSGN